MASTAQTVRIAIIGGGFAGLTLLIGLQKYPHIDAHVYESAKAFSEHGAGAILGPNSQRAMKLIDPRIFEGFEQRTSFNDDEPDETGLYPWVTVAKGQAPDIEQGVLELKHKTKGSTIHRAHFLDALIKLVEPHRIHLNKKVLEICEDDENEPVVLRFRDGTSEEADVVIGADGIHSYTRKYILGPDHIAAGAFFTGSIIYRTVVPMQVAKEVLGDLRQDFGIRCGKDGLVFGFPLAQRTFYFIAVVTLNNGPVPYDQWHLPTDLEKLKQHFSGFSDYVQKQVGLVPEATTTGWPIWEMPPAPTYFKGRVAIVGDAAHASTPFLGAGAGQAIEDSLVLHQVLGKYLDPARPKRFPFTRAQTVKVILQAYDTVRRFRSQKVINVSAETARFLTGNEPGVGMGAAELREHLTGRQHWIWDCDQVQQAKDAMLVFEEAEIAAAQTAAAQDLVGKSGVTHDMASAHL
nr:6-methylsalicylic acid decarboxylase ata [Quercus suber]